MSRKPKQVRDHYTESLAVNSQNLARQLARSSVPGPDAKAIIDAISVVYFKEVEKIAEDCERDFMALEKVPSPLGLFISCISQIVKDARSSVAIHLLQNYVAAWEDWM